MTDMAFLDATCLAASLSHLQASSLDLLPRRNQPSVEPIGRPMSPREARRAQLRTDAGSAARPFSTIHPDEW